MLRSDADILSRKSYSGRWLVGGLFVFGSLVLAGFYYGSRTADPAPASAQWAAPTRRLEARVLDRAGLARPETTETDLLFVTDLPPDQHAEMVSRIATSRASAYYPAQNIGGAGPLRGNAVFSRYPLYQARSIPNRGGSFGVWAVAVEGDRKFMVAAVALSPDPEERAKELDMLDKAWQKLGCPPMVAGGEWRGDRPANARDVGDGVLRWGTWPE